MAFDKNTEGQPIVELGKKTTQVNLSMIIGVGVFCLLFIILGALWLHHRAPGHAGNRTPAEQPVAPPVRPAP